MGVLAWKGIQVSHSKSELLAQSVAATQPVIYGVAGATVLGITVQDWVLVGTGILVVLNLALAITKIYQGLRGKK